MSGLRFNSYRNLDNFSDESKCLILDFLRDTYTFEWEKKRNIEHKAIQTVGLVGVFCTIIFAFLAYSDRTFISILFSTYISKIVFLLIVIGIFLSLIIGIIVIKVRTWHYFVVDGFLDFLINPSTTDKKLLKEIIEDHIHVIVQNQNDNNKAAKLLLISQLSFILSICIIFVYSLYLYLTYIEIF